MKRRPSTDKTVRPNLFIIGAAKAGTTTLYDTLIQYSDVYFPAIKEPAFFCDDEYYNKGVDWYSNTFYANTEKYAVRGDATSRYLFWGEKVVPRLQVLYGSELPRIIVIFRDPVSLVYSFYWQKVREGDEDLSFRAALDAEEERYSRMQPFLRQRGILLHLYSRIAAYASQLEPYLQIFPREKILFLFTEDFQDFSAMVEKLEQFLSLEHKTWNQPVRSNRSSLPRNQTLQQWVRQPSKIKETFKTIIPYSMRYRIKKMAMNVNLREIDLPPIEADLETYLRTHYEPEIKKLETIVQRDLSAWYTN